MSRRKPRSTVAVSRPTRHVRASTIPPRRKMPRPPARALPPPPRPRTEIGGVAAPREASLVDVLDNLLNRGVVLNADIILALADVDLVYVRLSALLCAADRLLPSPR
jgi:gas vesicle protein GvpA/GvpJ/GvpM family